MTDKQTKLRCFARALCVVFFLISLPFFSRAQLVVDNTLTPAQLVEVFLGNDIDATNVTVTLADNRQLAYFTNSNSNLGITEGIMMSSGFCEDMAIPGLNLDQGFGSAGPFGPGDTDLDALIFPNTTNDAVVLEFDFVPLSNTITFNYTFASEEYNEYACTDFNDVFAFFLTGVSTPFPTTNIATIPGSVPPLPVAINTVNNGNPGGSGGTVANCTEPAGSLSYSSLFVDNAAGGIGGSGSFIQFDGMTVTLQASATVVPCETYHIKLALADAFDTALDSGVFLEANSFTSGVLDVDVSTASVDPLVVEDCTGDVAAITLTLQQTQATDYNIPLNIFGTAINGTDYVTIPSSLTIPAGQNSVSFDIEPINDGIAESVETVQIEVQTSICTNDTITVFITENPPIPVPDLSCSSDMSSITFSWNADPGVLSYEVSTDGGATWGPPNPGPTSHLVSGLSQGDMVTIEVRPVGACNVGNIATLTCTADACTPSVTLTASDSEITCDITNITLTPNPSGIQGNATYQWSTGVTDNTGTGTISMMGDYTVTLTDDGNGCTATATINIGEDLLGPTATLASSAPEFNCNQPNGIVLTTSPTVQGTAAYEWNLPFLGTNATASIPSAGDYTVTVTDTDNGCTTTATINVGEDFADPVLVFEASDPEFNCGVDEMSLIAGVTGQGTISYNWSSGVFPNVGQDTGLVLIEGTYSVTVTDDDNGCTASESITLTSDYQQPSVTLSSSDPEFNCSIASMTLTASPNTQGLTSYAWSDGAVGLNDNVTITQSGDYTVTITDEDNGCTATASINVPEGQNPFSVSLVASDAEFSCDTPGPISITAFHALGQNATYQWSAGVTGTGQVTTIAATGDYTVTVTDASNGCTATGTVFVDEDILAPSVTLSQDEPEFNCNVSSIILTPTPTVQGTASYQWSTGVTDNGGTGTITAAGDYTVTVTDSDNGCTATTTINITEDILEPTVVLTPDEPEFNCNVSTITLTPTPTVQGTATYQWSAGVTDNGGTGTIASAGDYTVTITDSDNGCTSTTTINISEDVLAPSVSLSSDEPEFNCNVSSIVLTPTPTVQGTATYQWSTGVTDNGGTGTIASAGDYTVTITDSDNGCTSTATINIGEDVLAPSVSLSSDEPEFNCNVSSVVLTPTPTVQGTATYQWSAGVTDNGGTGTIASAGDYTVTITDSDNGCTSTATINIGEDVLAPSVSLSSDEPEFTCDVNSIVLTPTPTVQGTATYQWSAGVTDNGGTGTITTAGDYTVTITDDDNGCTATTTINIGEDVLAPSVSLSSDEPEFTCDVNSIVLTPTPTVQGTATYQWSAGITDNGGTGTITTAGDYTVTITDDDNGCTATTTINIGEDILAPSVSLSSDEPEFNCNINSIILTANPTVQGTATYQWSTGVTDNGSTGTITMSGDYTVTITDSDNGCTSTATINVPDDPLDPTVNLSSDEPEFNCTVNSITLTASPFVQGTATYQWSTGVIDNGVSGTITTSGDYTVTITDSDNGCTATATINITEDFLDPVVTLDSDEPEFNCNVSTITLTPTPTVQGTATYQWSAGVTDNGGTGTITTAGDYTVTITDDDNGCNSTAMISIGEDFLDPTVTLSSDEPEFNCNVSTITLTPAPTVQGTATYQWSAGVTDNGGTGTITTAGDYTVTITDSDNGCTSTAMINISEDILAPSVTLSQDEPEFNCNVNSIILTPTPTVQGTATYQWSTGVTDNGGTGTITTAGDYTVTITDSDNGCTAIANITITEDVLNPTVSLGSDEPEFNCNVSTITLTPTSTVQGTATYQWSAGVTDNGGTGTITTAGDYTVTITDDDNGCTSTATINITEDILNPTVSLGSDEPEFNCNVSTITLTPTPTVQGTATYQWSAGVTDNGGTGTITTAGDYTVTITDDDNGCNSTAMISIGEDFLDPTVTLTSDEPEFNCNVSTITLTPTSTVQGTATYQWSTGVTDNGGTGTITTAGDYTVTITDSDNGCTSTTTINIGENFTPPTANITPTGTQLYCTVNSINLDASTSTSQGALTYQWSAGVVGTGSVVSVTAAGTYTVTITDINGCTDETSVNITEVPPVVVTEVSTADLTCNGANDGAISVMASGGDGTYSYAWNGAAAGANDMATNLSPDTYVVTVTDGLGCTATYSYEVTEPLAITPTLTQTDISCTGGNDGTATASATGGTVAGGYGFEWSTTPIQTTATATGLVAGTYTVTVTDDNMCTATSQIDVNEPLALTLTISGTDVSCAAGMDGTASVVATDGTAGYTYLWSNSPPGQTAMITGLTAGTYTVTVTDANDCVETASITIDEPMAMTVTAIETQIQSDCVFPDGAASVSASNGAGGYTFAWGTNDNQTGPNATGLTAGTYFVTATDANGCTASTSVEINSTFTITPVETITDVDCNGSATGGIEIVTTGDGTNEPFTYDWGTSNANPFLGLTAGTYTVVITDNNNCSRQETYFVDEPDALVITVIDVNDATCSSSSDGSIVIDVSGGTGLYTYTWDGAATGQDDTVDNIPFGTYNVVVEDANGCQATEVINVGTPSPIIITLLGSTPANCTACDGTASINVSGGTPPYSYQWANGNNSPTPDNLCGGINTITVFDSNNCSATLDVNVDNVTTLVIDEIEVDDTSCPNSCDGEAMITASGGLAPFNYIWDANAGGQMTEVATGLCEGSYEVTVTDQNGCVVSGTAIVNSPEPLSLVLDSEDVRCFGEENGTIIVDTAFGGTPPYSYALADELFIIDTIFPLQPGGTQTVYIQDANGCLDSADVFVNQPGELIVTAYPLDTLINLGETVELTAIPNQDNTTISWSPSDSLSCGDCPNPTTSTYNTVLYTVTVTDTINGCVVVEELLVRVNKDRNIFVPNAFTPNDDGFNDFLTVYTGPTVANIRTFQVFDRWGELVYSLNDFQPNSQDLGWDGYFNGKPMNSAVFVYFLEAEFIDGHIEKFTGDVTLVR